MSEKIERYWFEIASRASEEQSAEQKHAAFFDRIRHLPEPWGLGSRSMPEFPSFEGGVTAILDMEPFLKIASMSIVTYQFRARVLRESRSGDDCLLVIVDSSNVDLKYLAYTIIPAYIQAFDAYRVDFADERASDISRAPGNPRFVVKRLGRVCYFDDFLCNRAFKLNATALVELFRGKIEYSSILQGGAYLIGNSTDLSFEESESLSNEMYRTIVWRPRGNN